MAPAQTSGAFLKELRTTAEFLASRERDRPVPQSPAVRSSLPRNNSSSFPPAGETEKKPASPSTKAPKTIFPSEDHASQEAEAFISGVTFLGDPPAAGMTWISPPTESSSLMRPSTNAMPWPSGDHAGRAICNLGL